MSTEDEIKKEKARKKYFISISDYTEAESCRIRIKDLKDKQGIHDISRWFLSGSRHATNITFDMPSVSTGKVIFHPASSEIQWTVHP